MAYVCLIGAAANAKNLAGLFRSRAAIQQTRSYRYVNFDDERLVGIGDYDEIITALNAVYGNPQYLLEEVAGRITAFFWRGSQGEEVDLIVKEGLRISQLIQVCADISNQKIMKRELRALTRASLELNCTDMLLLNDRIDGSETLNWQGAEHKIRIMPVWKWLENRI